MAKYRVIDLFQKVLLLSTDDAKYAHSKARENVRLTGNDTVIAKTSIYYERQIKKTVKR